MDSYIRTSYSETLVEMANANPAGPAANPGPLPARLTSQSLGRWITNGGNPNIVVPAGQAWEGDPLLTYAAAMDLDHRLIRLMLQRGANAEAIGSSGMTALQAACAQPADIDVVKALVRGGANPNSPGNSGRTPLEYAEERLADAIGANEPDERDNLQEIVDFLLARGPPIYPAWPGAAAPAPPVVALPAPEEGQGNTDMPGRPVSVISMSGIAPGTQMVDFHGERDHGRYYTLEEFQGLPITERRKKNPSTRQVIEPANVTFYTAQGGRRRKAKTRKAKKSRKSTRRARGRKGGRR